MGIVKLDAGNRAPIRDYKVAIEQRSMPEPNSGCWIWIGPVWTQPNGWLSPNIGGGRTGWKRLAARVSYEAFRGPIPDGLLVCHRCDNSLCVNPDHLFVGTNQDNVDDMVAKGRARSGHGRRLSAEQIEEIRKSTEVRALARRFGCMAETITYHRKKFRTAA